MPLPLPWPCLLPSTSQATLSSSTDRVPTSGGWERSDRNGTVPCRTDHVLREPLSATNLLDTKRECSRHSDSRGGPSNCWQLC
ncbi:hypothetical protein NL676_022752 [Syzygium grande]|nr:hypothetical protein NL676_022752 [Syzygium grande]